jgi:hypothetical protein
MWTLLLVVVAEFLVVCAETPRARTFFSVSDIFLVFTYSLAAIFVCDVPRLHCDFDANNLLLSARSLITIGG